MKLKIFAAILMIGLVWFGVQTTYVTLTNLTPTVMTCEEFSTNGTSAAWVELTDCFIDYKSAVSLESKVLKVDKGVYVPVRPFKAKNKPAALLLSMPTKKAEERLLTSISNELAKTGASTPTNLSQGETLNGMLLFGIDGLDSKRKTALESMVQDGVVVAGYQVIEEGKKPSVNDLPFAVFAIFGPIIGGFFWIRNAIKGKKPSPTVVASSTTPPPLPANIPPPPPMR